MTGTDHLIAPSRKQSPPMLSTGESASEVATPSTPENETAHSFGDASILDSETPASVNENKSAASQLKRSFSQYRGRAPSGKRLTGENDPENREILRLRQEEDLEFEAIARILNEQRVKKGTSPHLTPNAIYSRYKRNGPLIAASEGRQFVPTSKDHKSNGHGIKFKETIPISGFDPEQDELLVKAFSDIEGRKWELVAARLHELGGKKHEPIMCARRYECI